MNPIFLGRAQCFNVDYQCLSGEENFSTLLNNPKLEQAFEEGCSTVNPTNRIIRCCPLNLINQPYFPRESKIPIHTKKIGNEHQLCPEGISSECIRETDPERFISCVAEKCNDAGYLEANNYYQVCKAYKQKGAIESIPDCPNRRCEQMMSIPQWYIDELDGKSKPLPPPLLIPQSPAEKVVKAPEEQGYSLKNLSESLPTEKNFYSWGSLVLGIIAIIIITILFFIIPNRNTLYPSYTAVF